MDIKFLLAGAATAIAIISYVPYIRDIWKGKTQPHAFSWFVWALLTGIAGVAQLQAGAGVGSIVAFTTTTICLYIVALAWRHHRQLITRSDWLYFSASLLTIPLWIITKDPLLSVILVCVIDLAGFVPTIRKSYNLPYSETLSTHYLSTLKHVLTIGALQHYSLVTVLFPGSLIVTTGLFTLMLLVRRRQVPAPKASAIL